MHKTLKNLKKENIDIFSKIIDNEKIASLLKKPEPEQNISEEMLSGVRQIREFLNKTGYWIRFEPIKNIDPNGLVKELETTYNCVVYNYLKCRINPRQVNFHELRKR